MYNPENSPDDINILIRNAIVQCFHVVIVTKDVIEITCFHMSTKTTPAT